MKVIDEMKAYVEAVEKWVEDMKAHVMGAPKPPMPPAPAVDEAPVVMPPVPPAPEPPAAS